MTGSPPGRCSTRPPRSPSWSAGSATCRCRRRPRSDLRSLPGGVANTTHGEGVRRGVGYGVGIKNICFSEGFDDYSTARVTVQVVGDEPLVTVHTAAVEVGQGIVTLQEQIARTELGIAHVRVESADTRVGSAGSTSASRQSYVTGGAVQAACREVAAELLSRASVAAGVAPATLSLEDGHVVGPAGERVAAVADLVGGETVERTVEWRHRPTTTLDPETGQGSAHVQFAFAAHRAVVDVDVELGLVKVVALDCAQDVGRALNPGAVLGQIHGGSAQGLGLAVMEEIQVVDGLVRNPSFTDYLIPTVLDMPPMRVDDPRARRPARAVRPARGGGAADDLLDAGRRRRDPRRDRAAADPGAGPARAPDRHLSSQRRSRAVTTRASWSVKRIGSTRTTGSANQELP